MNISRDLYHETKCPGCLDVYDKTGTDCIVFNCKHFCCTKCALRILQLSPKDQIKCPMCRKVIFLELSKDIGEKKYIKTATGVGLCSVVGLYFCIAGLTYNGNEIDAEDKEIGVDLVKVRNYLMLGFGVLLGTFCYTFKYLKNAHEDLLLENLGFESYALSKKTIYRIKYYPQIESEIIDV